MSRIDRIVDDMTFETPPENRGQIVTVSYGWSEGRLYRLTEDGSDHSRTLEICDEDESGSLPESWHPANGEPDVNADAWSEVRS